MGSRRCLLALVTVGILTAGCSAPLPIRAPVDNGGHTSVAGRERLRAEAPGLTVERTLELGEHETYLPTNETIKYPKSTSGMGEFTYGYVTLETYLRLDAGLVATDALQAHLERRLPATDQLDVSLTAVDGEPVLTIRYLAVVDNGTVVDAPAVPVVTVVDEAPRTVTVSVRLRTESYRASYPVFVQPVTDRYLRRFVP